MSGFFLEIITPEKTFYRGEVESVNIPSLGGACTIMAGHQPMVFATEPGTIRITADGVTREAFMSEGFIEVRPDETIAFAQAVEWPEDINERRAAEAKERAEEQLRRERHVRDREKYPVRIVCADMSERFPFGDGEFDDLVTDVVVRKDGSGRDGDGVGAVGERTDAACVSGNHVYADQRAFVLGRRDETANRDGFPPPLG